MEERGHGTSRFIELVLPQCCFPSLITVAVAPLLLKIIFTGCGYKTSRVLAVIVVLGCRCLIMSGRWTLPCHSCSLLQVLSDKERKKILEFIERQRNSRASVLFLTLIIYFVMSVPYWTSRSGSNSSPFDLNCNNSLTTSSSIITSQSISSASVQ